MPNIRLSGLSGVVLLCVLIAACERSGETQTLIHAPRSPADKATSVYGAELLPDEEKWTIQEYPSLKPDALLDSGAVLVVEGTDVTPIAVEAGNRIETWQELAVVDVLRGRWDTPCRPQNVPQEIRTGLRRGEKRVAMRLLGGSLTVENTPRRRVQHGPAGSVRFRVGARYLAFGELCAGVLELEQGPHGVFGVGGDGTISTFAWEGPEPQSRQTVLSLATIKELTVALEKRERTGRLDALP